MHLFDLLIDELLAIVRVQQIDDAILREKRGQRIGNISGQPGQAGGDMDRSLCFFAREEIRPRLLRMRVNHRQNVLPQGEDSARRALTW